MLTISEALAIITRHRRVAVVGLSPKPERPSFRVGRFLLDRGFQVTPINPGHREIMNRSCVANLRDLDSREVDWIDFFVNPGKLPEFIDEVIRLRPKLVWCQIGVVNADFNAAMEKAQIPFIVDLCPKIELERSGT